MLNEAKLVAFVITADSTRARAFYEGLLGLRFVSDDQYALVMESNGNQLRIGKMPNFKATAQHTVLGWEVSDIEKAVTALGEKGITFEKYGFPGQNERGIWSTPNGDKVAWFKDPDGNTLSLGQHPKR
jgi:catechol 2,3-dioxygenase-like lactoylglutathione lyase family enzyme